MITWNSNYEEPVMTIIITDRQCETPDLLSINLFSSPTNNEVGTSIIIPALQIRKQRHSGFN
jgi:hypothetical protein